MVTKSMTLLVSDKPVGC